MDLVDPTGQVQLEADANTLEDDSWQQILKLKRGIRVYVEGVVSGESRQGQVTIRLSSHPTPVVLAVGTLAEVSTDDRRVGAQMIVSVIKRQVEKTFDELGYIRIETRSLSTAWTSIHEVGTLRVLYPGFGVPAYLVPTPAPQLVEALIASGEDRLYTSATSFLTSFRTSLDGVEASMVVSKSLHLDLEHITQHVLALLEGVRQALHLPEGSFRMTLVRYPLSETDDTNRLLAEREMQVLKNADDHSPAGRTELLRTVVAPGIVPIEVVVQIPRSGAPLGTINVYLERFLPLVSHIPVRTLANLSARDLPLEES